MTNIKPATDVRIARIEATGLVVPHVDYPALIARIRAEQARADAAFQRGAEAMLEASVAHLVALARSTPRWGSPEEHAHAIRNLPIPKDKP